MFCSNACRPGNPATDTVKVDLTTQQQAEADQLISEVRRNVEEAEQSQAEAEEAARQYAQQQAEEAARLRAEEEAAEAAEAQRAEEARRKAEEEEAKRAEEARRAREAAEKAAEAARKAEAERIAEERRKAAMAAFLKEHGFSGVSSPRKKLMKTSYAIHKAAKQGDAQVVEQLLKEGANASQKDSRGKTAFQIAELKNSKGSHAAVLALLRSPAKPRMAGA